MKNFPLGCLGLLLSSALGCAADVAPADTSNHGPAPVEQLADGQTFDVQLPLDVTVESVIPAIVAAGHEELAAACDGTPGAAIRVLNPLASGSFEDVSCASILSGEESTAATSAALADAEPIGQVQQKGVITTVACFASGATIFLGTRYGICPHGKTEKVRTDCNDVGSWGNLGIALICGITAIFPF